MFSNKRYYGVSQFYGFIRVAVRNLPTLIRAERTELIPSDFREKIMLAVTEVNGCDLCSQVHTAKALKAGMSQAEIGEMLRADHGNVADTEGVAIMFAQHYADSAGQPENETVERLLSTYGEEKSRDIMAFVRMIMAANIHGNALFVLKQRFSGKTVSGMGLGTACVQFFGLPIFIFVALINNLFSNPLHSQG